MKSLLLFAVVGFVLAISRAIPVREEDIQAKEDKLMAAINDLKSDNTERYDKIYKINKWLYVYFLWTKDLNNILANAALLIRIKII